MLKGTLYYNEDWVQIGVMLTHVVVEFKACPDSYLRACFTVNFSVCSEKRIAIQFGTSNTFPPKVLQHSVGARRRRQCCAWTRPEYEGMVASLAGNILLTFRASFPVVLYFKHPLRVIDDNMRMFEKHLSPLFYTDLPVPQASGRR